MVKKINVNRTADVTQSQQKQVEKRKDDGTFKKILTGTAKGALAAASAIGGGVGGGGLGAALQLFGGDSAQFNGGNENIDNMWQMQEQNQAFNMQYLELQTQLQSDNREFSTMSNLMKARHDTAKSAINNMHV